MDVTAIISRGGRICHHGIFDFKSGKISGFTLLELLIAITVLSVVLGIGIPSFHHFIASNRVTSQINSLVGIMALARSEAIKRGQSITLCQTKNNQICDSTGNWSDGWMLFLDENNNKKLENDEQIIYTGQKLSGDTQILFNGSFGIDGYIVYKADGSAFPNGTFSVCPDEIPNLSKALILFRTGRLRLSNKTARGKPVSCS